MRTTGSPGWPRRGPPVYDVPFQTHPIHFRWCAGALTPPTHSRTPRPSCTPSGARTPGDASRRLPTPRTAIPKTFVRDPRVPVTASACRPERSSRRQAPRSFPPSQTRVRLDPVGHGPPEGVPEARGWTGGHGARLPTPAGPARSPWERLPDSFLQ
jgi:hypothetical protein